MSYFKKFTDFAAGVAVFVASLFLIRRYMSFYPDESILEEQSKLQQFLADKSVDATMHLYLIFFLVLAIAIGIIFRKFPYVPLAFSIIPAIYVCFMFTANIIYEQIVLFFAAAALLIIGNLVECIYRDREDGRHRMFVATKIISAISAITCFYIGYLSQNPPVDKEFSDLNSFQKEIFFHNTETDATSLYVLGAMFAAVFIIGLILYNVYFVDAIVSLVPLGYSLYALFWEKLTIAPIIFVALAATCFIANVMLMILENNLSKKEQNIVKKA